MTNSKKNIYWMCWIIIVVISSLIYSTFAWIEQWTLSLEIRWIWIRHGTPANANLWAFTVSGNDQEISGQFNDYFWVEDLQGIITGYYTTVQCDGIYGSSGNKLTWVYLKAGNTSPTFIMGLTGNVLISTGIYNYVSILDPVIYMYKPTNVGNGWLVNKYWDKPRFKIIIPGWTPAGSYSWTITFDLHMY